jgi:transposase-like protein
MSKPDLRNPIYHDEDAARSHLESLLWPHGPVCPRCGVTENRITKLQGKSTRPGVYKCKDCRKPFSVTIGTVMERSHLPLSKWILAARFMAASKKGMSALQLQRMMGTNYETAWFLFHRLREAVKPPINPSPLGGEGKVVEADETYVGGKEVNKHRSKRSANVYDPANKAAVFALLKRGVYGTFHNVSEAHLQRYLWEFDFRYNLRQVSDWDRAAELLRGAKGKRLTYHQAA